MCKISAIQMCSSSKVDENIKAADKLIKEAAQNDAKLVVLPEMFAIMGIKPTDKIKEREEYNSGKIQDFLSKAAMTNDIWIVAGTIPIACRIHDKIRAACIVYDNHGNTVARYDKTHLFDATLSATESYRESDTTDAGNGHPVVVDTPVGKLGLAVCFDIRFPELFLQLYKKGAEIIALPSAFTVPTGTAHWEILTRSCAIQNFCYLIGACQSGKHDSGRETFGHSMIIDPWGKVLANHPKPGNGIIYADIDLEYLTKVRSAIPLTRLI
ncbi:MAG: carbon-nitrogen hydrolase family protein [Gammaproteobacteria bacterium]|nr:carbon-nitrogen hydrolase family protein [Gammaproteobacteria bacterium]